MINCRRATELISEELEVALPLTVRVGLELHSLICPGCRRFRRRVELIHQGFEELFSMAEDPHTTASLPAASKSQLKEIVSAVLDSEL